MPNLSTDYHMILDYGRFDGTTREDLAKAMRTFEAVDPANGLVLHLHGGLIGEESGLGIASRLPRAL